MQSNQVSLGIRCWIWSMWRIDLSRISRGLEKWAVIAWKKALDLVTPRVLEKTPTDTRNLYNSRKEEINEMPWRVEAIGYFDNEEAEYAEIVEAWKWRAFNYHKWPPRDASTVFYSGVGAWMVRRSADESEAEVRLIIKDTLNDEVSKCLKSS